MNELRGELDGTGKHFAIVVSRFHELITERLLDAARGCLLEHGVAPDQVMIARVPGAWELPVAAQRLAQRRTFAGIIALGCVVRGETPHFEYVAGEAARGLAEVALGQGVPVAFGLLTTDSMDQAIARAGGSVGNKGWEAALSALEMAGLFERLES
ncbi:MAG: 6,7-dimethyl-8-ribityllumazine synthase [Longimicrobiales bacterium]